MRNSAPTRKPAPFLFYGKVPEPDCPQTRIVRTSGLAELRKRTQI